MRLFKIASILLATHCFSLSAWAQDSILQKLNESAQSVVRIENQVQGVVRTDTGKIKIARYASVGGGFVIDQAGTIVTNAHVVKGKGRVTVLFPDGSKQEAKVTGKLDSHDLAFLEVPSVQKMVPLKFSEYSKIRLHDKVYAVGTSPSLASTISQGQVTGLGKRKKLDSHSREGVEVMQLNFNVYEGDSGSPVFDRNGDLLGMTTAALKNINRVSYAIPAPAIKKAYELLIAQIT